MSVEKQAELGLTGAEWIEHPLKKIEYHVGRNASRGRGGGKAGKAGGRSKDQRRFDREIELINR